MPRTQKQQEYSRQYYQLNREKIREAARASYSKNKGNGRNRNNYMRAYMTAQRLRRYGITPDQYRDLLTHQNGKCAICESPDTGNPRFFPIVDHCHKNNRVRGILCSNCNQALGKMKDDPNLLRKAAQYLERNA